MKSKKLSTLGYIMDYLNIQTKIMAKSLHVDPSLVSKWKSGARQFTEKSVYFDDVIAFILDTDKKDNYKTLINALNDLFPNESVSEYSQIEQQLRIALSSKNSDDKSEKLPVIFGNVKTVPVMIFDNLEGRHEAVRKIFDYAESLSEPGELTFIDTDSFQWIWNDTDFSQYFTQRLLKLLNNGYHAAFAIRNSSSNENFRRFFDSCNPIIFHKNVNWYYVQYYDLPIIGFTFILLNRSVSVLGMFTQESGLTTMAFRDTSVILQHEYFAGNFIQKCIPMFEKFYPFDMPKIIADTPNFRKNRSFYAFLPVPAFIAVNTTLLKNVLRENKIEESSDVFCNVMELNQFFRELTGIHNNGKIPENQKTILIFQIEKIIERARKKKFISNSLSLSCKKNIIIKPQQYAYELRSLANICNSNPDVSIVLASEKDAVPLPYINCWCMQNSYLLQMYDKGFRLCEESTLVSVAFNALECCIHKIPPERKEQQSVSAFLTELADELEKSK